LAGLEQKIQQLEYRLENIKMTSSDGSKCASIAKLELQLVQLYNQAGNSPKAQEMMDDAQKVLEDPMCPRTRETDSMLRYIKFYKSNPGLANVKPMPPIYRYLSLIVLAVGYLGLYLASVYVPNFPSNDYFFGILGIFVVSMAINSLVRSNYNRKVRGAVGQPQAGGNEEDIARLEAKVKEDRDYPNPERILDGAKAELELAVIYYNRSDYASSSNHLSQAEAFLNDPLCENDQERERIMKSAAELRTALSNRQTQ
jgi:tetratricopeptide (TPR) repeat protein